MSCNHPLHAFRTGRLTENGKEEYIITSGEIDRLSYESAMNSVKGPLLSVHMENINGRRFLVDPLEIPCGKCVGCRMAKAKEWSVRCALERSYYPEDDCLFLTLTYDDDHLPKDGWLCKRDLQLFWKRLRKAGFRFRYFACGEYGETYHRPHYHAIVFGLHLDDLDFFSVSHSMSQLYVSSTLSGVWQNGLCVAGYADSGSIAYTAGYVEKKQNDPAWDSYAVKPFITMSRKPAIGTRYLLDNTRSIIGSNKVYGDFGNCHSYSVPRHFVRKIGQEDELWLAGRSAVMQERGKAAKSIEHCVYGISNDQYLGFVKDELLIQKLNKIERS